MKTQRFNHDWLGDEPNGYFFGLVNLLGSLENYLLTKNDGKFPSSKIRMLEIGSHMGESTMMFAASHLFYEIHCIDPFEGHEQFNVDNNYDWNFVEEQFKINTRFFNNINLHKNYSYNIVDKFSDEYFDFIYIDASHRYEDVKRDIESYLPKLKKDGIISGHDYHEERWPGVTNAVNEILGEPDQVYWDTSWIKYEVQDIRKRSTKTLY